MRVEWNRHEIADLIERNQLFIGDGYRAKNDELASHGLPFARARNINEGFLFVAADCFPEEDIRRVGNKVSEAGDVVFTSKGTVGRFAFVRPDTPRFVYSPQLCFWRAVDKEVIHPRFLYYWMSGREFFLQFKGVAGQTDMAEYVSLTDQRRMHITLPTLDEQRAIAHILGTLDDKIELNWRMNETLQAIARMLFKSWFVDFDPVRAKAEGRQPFGMGAETAALFPDCLQDSPLGKIPKDWQVRDIGDALDAVGGSTPSTEEPTFWDGEISFCTPKDMASLQSPVLLDTERRITEAGLQQISSGLLPTGTVLLSSRAPIGYLAVAEIPVSVNQGIIAMICIKDLPTLYVLFWVKENMDTIVANANGTTFLEISKKNFRPIKALVPAPTVLSRFVDQVSPYYEQIVNNLKQSKTLVDLRDSLLPKLISGEVRVPLTDGS